LRTSAPSWVFKEACKNNGTTPGLAAEIACILEDTDIAGVRGEQTLDKLPPAERSDWQQFRKEVEVLRQRAARPPDKAAASRP
jgi:hypothetical protein